MQDGSKGDVKMVTDSYGIGWVFPRRVVTGKGKRACPEVGVEQGS